MGHTGLGAHHAGHGIRRLAGARSGCGSWLKVGSQCFFVAPGGTVPMSAARARCRSIDPWADLAQPDNAAAFSNFASILVDGQQYWLGARLYFNGK